jgi:hypothetical protein
VLVDEGFRITITEGSHPTGIVSNLLNHGAEISEIVAQAIFFALNVGNDLPLPRAGEIYGSIR